MGLHNQPQIHYGRDFPIESVPLDLSSNREGRIAQLIQTIRYGEHGWDGVGGSSVVSLRARFLSRPALYDFIRARRKVADHARAVAKRLVPALRNPRG